MTPTFLEQVALNEERNLIEYLKLMDKYAYKGYHSGKVSLKWLNAFDTWVDDLCDNYCHEWEDLPRTPETPFKEYCMN